MSILDQIKNHKGPCAILAGAGTGKTYTIIEKLKHFISSNIYPTKKIVCITFSNEAVNNLSSRMREFLKDSTEEPIIRTFHGFSADIIKEHGHLIGIKKEFKILDPDQAKILLHRNFRIQPYFCHKYISSIGIAKDLDIKIQSLEAYLEKKMKKYGGIDIKKRLDNLNFEFLTHHLKKEDTRKFIKNQIKELNDIINLQKFINTWKAYEKIKSKNGYLDYSDLNKESLLILNKFPEIKKNYEYFIIDEFQDTNKVQLELIFSLTDKNITIVGDLNQSIYRFRGAFKDNFELFKEHYNISKEDIFNLAKSRRSSNKILRIAHKLVINNYENTSDCFEVKNFEDREGENIRVYELKNSNEEARKILELIQEEQKNDTPLKEICVIFRTHQQGRTIKHILGTNNIPHISVTKESLLKDSIVKAIIDYLTIIEKIKLSKKGGEQAWWDLIYQMGVPEEDLIKFGTFIKQNFKLDNISTLIYNSLESMGQTERGQMILNNLKKKLDSLIKENEKDVLLLIEKICSILGIFNEESKGNKFSFLNINKFYEFAKQHSQFYHPDLESFLNYLEVIETLGIEVQSAEINEEGVRLMTAHSTKGLEFDTVILTNMASKRFPVEKITNNSLIPPELLPEIKKEALEKKGDLNSFYEEFEMKNQMMEERRLCYVSLTRARKKLIMTYSQEYSNKKHYPSKFLYEIDYKNDKDINFLIELEEKYVNPKNTKALKFHNIIENKNFDNLIKEISIPVKNKKKIFSPSSLLLFTECEKKFEYKYVFNMPEKKTISWEAMKLGSFVHKVLEKGVTNCLPNVSEFINLAKNEHAQEDWCDIEIEEALSMIKVFFERNRNKYNNKSQTEKELRLKIGEYEFVGIADRIDFNNGIEIIDYKTGKTPIKPKHRDWQLGYYALAAAEKFKNQGPVKKVTLDMLKQENPLEFIIDEEGNAKAVNSSRLSFNIYEIKDQLFETAQKIKEAYEKGFKPCPIEKNCEFCNEYVYGIK